MKSRPKSPIAYIETQEQRRLHDAREAGIPWKNWAHISAKDSGARSEKTILKERLFGLDQQRVQSRRE